MTQCVICHIACDDSGLCDDHKYDEQTETSDSVPHVHHVRESVPWWAEAFPQWKGKGHNDKP